MSPYRGSLGVLEIKKSNVGRRERLEIYGWGDVGRRERLEIYGCGDVGRRERSETVFLLPKLLFLMSKTPSEPLSGLIKGFGSKAKKARRRRSVSCHRADKRF